MVSHQRHFAAWFCAASTWLAASSALAGGQDSAVAESLYTDALALMKQSNYEAACPKLEESQRLDPAVGTLLYLGECYDKQGKTSSAWSTFMSAAEAAQRAGQTDREQIARERVRDLSARVPKLVISVPPAARITGLDVQLDRTLVREPIWGTPTAADPGQHEITVSAPGRKTWRATVVLPPNDSPVTVELPVLEPAEATAQPPVAPTAASSAPTSPGPATPAHSPRWPTVGWIAAGTGVMGLGLGTALGIYAKRKEDQSTTYCLDEDNTVCAQKGVDMIEKAERAATVANVSFVLGGMALASGAAILLFAPSTEEKPRMSVQWRLAPTLGPSNAGLLLDGRF